MSIPGLGSLVASCSPFAGSEQFRDTSGQPVTVFMNDLSFATVNTIDNGALSPPTPGRFISHDSYGVSLGTGAKGQMATIEVFLSADANSCSFQAQPVSLTA